MERSLISRKELDNLSGNELIERAKDFAKLYCVGNGNNFRLKDYPTDDYPKLKKKEKKIF